jgi:hypothetical protein
VIRPATGTPVGANPTRSIFSEQVFKIIQELIVIKGIMAKRFTDTDKWKDSWFRKLPHEYQLFWICLLDQVDNAGVWKVDFELVEFFLKHEFDPAATQKIFAERIHVFDGGKKWFVPKFISFQYGHLEENCRPHAFVLKLLKGYGLKEYLKGMQTLKDKNKDKDKDKDKEKDREPKVGPTNEFREAMQKIGTGPRR